MKRLTAWLVTAAFASTMTLGTPSFAAAAADEQGWGLLIKSPHVGVVYLYITSDGFALVIKETGAKFVTHAPDWKLVMYNDKTQVYYVERLSDLQNATQTGKGRKTATAMRQANMQNARAGRTETIAGMKAQQFFINTASPESGSKNAEVWITKDIQPPAQLHKTFEKLFSLNMSGQFPQGLPLRIKIADDAGKRELIYDTLNCQKQMIHTASFNYPGTYRRVDSELAVLMDEKSRKKMESILDDSDDISSLLGSASSSSAKPSSFQPASSTVTSPPRKPAAPAPRPVAATPAPRQNKPNDWWSQLVNMFGGGK